MSRAVARTVFAACVLAALAGCAASGTPSDGPGSLTPTLHGQTTVTFGAVSR